MMPSHRFTDRTVDELLGLEESDLDSSTWTFYCDVCRTMKPQGSIRTIHFGPSRGRMICDGCYNTPEGRKARGIRS